MTHPAPFPADEDQRLKALERYKILDTEPEEAFDRLTGLAKEIFQAKIALVSLVDRDRQWFKAKQGLDARETPRDVAFCAHAILRDQVLVVPDATLDERFKANPLVTGPPHIRSYAGAPLITKEGLRLGTLCVIHDQVTHLSAQQISQLERLATMVVDELELRYTLGEVAAVQEELEYQTAGLRIANAALDDQANQLAALVEDREALYQSVEGSRRFIEKFVETVPIPIYSRDQEHRVTHANPAYAAFLGLDVKDVIGKHIDELYDHKVASEIRDYDDELLASPSGQHCYERRVYRGGQDSYCDIVVYKALIRASDGTAEGVVSAIIDVTEQNALREKLERLASTDPLTGAVNRRAFLDRAEGELRRHRRYDRPLSLIMIDIDYFKRINDTFGHEAGDLLLCLLCKVCENNLRTTVDVLARLGGEEFAVLAPETGAKGAAILAERLRQEIARQKLDYQGQEITFTASFGVVSLAGKATSMTIADALRQADNCLYASKNSGRNRVTAFDEPTEEGAALGG